MRALLPSKELGFVISYFFGDKTGFPLSRMTINNLISPINFAIIQVLPFLNNPKGQAPFSTDRSRPFDCFGREKTVLLLKKYRTGQW